MLEFYCLTGEFSSTDNIRKINSFRNNLYNPEKFDYICTNPPYGGDKINKTEEQDILNLLKKNIEDYLINKYNKNIKSETALEKKDLKIWKQYKTTCKRLEELKLEYEKQITRLSNSSDKLKIYAMENGINIDKCKDKESVSLLLMMMLLKNNGTAVGVLKEGIFFDNKYNFLRKHLVENFNIKKIISVDSSQFENTSTKTSIILFENTGKTETIKFNELIVDKEEKTEFHFDKDKKIFILESLQDRIKNVYEKKLMKQNIMIL
jgi:type I restriction-modification system DNA methylase subunit